MSWIAPPQNEVGNPLTFINPSTLGTSVPANSFQVQNASPYVVTVQAIANNIQIQPYNAVTVPVSQDQNVVVNAAFLVYPNFSVGYVSGQWLEANEQPNVPDGPLTAAAQIATALGSGPVYLGSFGGSSLAPGASFSIKNSQINTTGILSFMVVVQGSASPGPTNCCVLVQGTSTVSGSIAPAPVSGDVCYISGSLAGQLGICIIDCLNAGDTNPNTPVITVGNLGVPTSQTLQNCSAFVYGYPIPAEQLRDQINKTTPVIVTETDVVSGGSGVSVLPAPPSLSGAVVPQTVTQLNFITIQGGTAVANTTAGYVRGSSSSAIYAIVHSSATGVGETIPFTNLTISEGLNASNSTAVTIGFIVGYRILAAQTT